MDYVIDFMAVGNTNGDAICLRYLNIPTLTTDIIDGGYSDIGEVIIDHLVHMYGSTVVANVLLTHADDDHARGLIPVLQRCNVGALYMNRPWLYAQEILPYAHGNYTVQGLVNDICDEYPYLIELENIALTRGIPILDAFQGTRFGCSTILAPSRPRYINLLPSILEQAKASHAPPTNPFAPIVQAARNTIDSGLEYWGVETLEENPEPTTPSNESSVVQLVQFGTYRAVFTGDAGPDALHEAANYAYLFGQLTPPNMFQIPHQGSRRNVTPSVLDRWLGPRRPSESLPSTAYAACSVGKKKTSHPRKKVANAFKRRGYDTVIARHDKICFYSASMKRHGWNPLVPLPFYTDVTEDDE